MSSNTAKFSIGQIVRHRLHPFRGVIVDIDPVFSNSDAWYERVATSRPRKDQPWYHLLAESEGPSYYTAYVSEQNLEPDETAKPLGHPEISEHFGRFHHGSYPPKRPLN